MTHLLSVFLIFLLFTPSAQADEKERVVRENQLLESETRLAGNQGIYFVFKLTEKKLYIKVRGATLKGFDLRGAHVWAGPLPSIPVSLQKKGALIKPKRSRINPGETKKSDNFEIDALEVEDMPSVYSLSFDNGVTVNVRPVTQGVLSFLRNTINSVITFLTRPVATVWNRLFKRPYTEIDIVLDKRDSQAFYWAFQEGYKAVIYPQ